MKRSILTAAALLALFTFAKLEAQAQDRWSLEFRPGVNFAAKDIGNADLGTGVGFEAAAAYSLMPHLAFYAGWSWNNFGVEQSFAGTDASFEETGYTFGFQFIHPVAESNLRYLVRLGGTYNHLEIENDKGDIMIDSGHGLGLQAEAGLVIALNEKLSLMPGIRYRSLAREIKINNLSTHVDLNYFSAGVSLSWSF